MQFSSLKKEKMSYVRDAELLLDDTIFHGAYQTEIESKLDKLYGSKLNKLAMRFTDSVTTKIAEQTLLGSQNYPAIAHALAYMGCCLANGVIRRSDETLLKIDNCLRTLLVATAGTPANLYVEFAYLTFESHRGYNGNFFLARCKRVGNALRALGGEHETAALQPLGKVLSAMVATGSLGKAKAFATHSLVPTIQNAVRDKDKLKRNAAFLCDASRRIGKVYFEISKLKSLEKVARAYCLLEAKKCFEHAYEYSLHVGDGRHRYQVCRYLSSAEEALGNNKAALQYAEQAVETVLVAISDPRLYPNNFGKAIIEVDNLRIRMGKIENKKK